MADIDDVKFWNVQNVSNCDFVVRENVHTFPLRQLQLGRCQGDVPPGPMIITSFFTASETFSFSEMFTKSDAFSYSYKFTESKDVTKSSGFDPSTP